MRPLTLKQLLKTSIPRTILILLVFLAYALSGTATTYFFKYITNDLSNGNWSGFAFWIIVELIISIFTILLLPLGTFLFNKQIQEYLHEIRAKIMKHYYAAEPTKVADMQNQLGNNLKVLSDDYATPWIKIWINLLSIIMAIGTLLTLHWSLILIVTVVTIIVLCLPQLMTKKLSSSTAKAAQKNAQFLNTIENWFSGLGELRRYGAGGRLAKALGQDNQKLTDANVNSNKMKSIAIVINGVGNSIGQVGTGLWAGLLFFRHIISLGDWAIAGGFASTIFNGLWEIISAITQIRSTKELRADVTKLIQPLPERKPKAAVYGLKCRNLEVQYQNGESITYPDFTINQGDKVLLTGDSGTGKSTLFKVLLGKIEPQNGEVYFIDQAGNKLLPKQAELGYVAQDATLFPDTVANNITMFNQKLSSRLSGAVQNVQLASDIASFPQQIDTNVDLDQGNLSGGQRQKVVLARAEIHDKPFLLLDEATSAVDSKTTNKIISELLQTDKTVLLIAHNFSPDLMEKFDYQICLKAKKKEVK